MNVMVLICGSSCLNCLDAQLGGTGSLRKINCNEFLESYSLEAFQDST